MYKDNQSKATATPAHSVKRQYISRNTIAAAAGAIIMLISLAFPWYAIRFQDYDNNIAWDMNISYLITDTTSWWSLWIGAALPAIGIVVVASIAVLSILHSLWKGLEHDYLWGRLGLLAVAFVIVNALYIFIWMRNHFGEWINIVDPGVVIVFVGALILALSQLRFRKKSL